MRVRRAAVVAGATVLALSAGVLVRRRTAGPVRPPDVIHARNPGAPPAGTLTLPVEEWTTRFTEREAAKDWTGLDHDLDRIREEAPALYEWYRLDYLHARSKVEAGRFAQGLEALGPSLAPGHPFRDLALFHAARAAEALGNAEEAGRFQEELVSSHPQATYRQRALEDRLAALSEKGDLEKLLAFQAKAGSLDPALVRDLESRIVAAQVAKDPAAAAARGLPLLKAAAGDDPADRIAQALDRPEILDRLGPEEWLLLGETFRSHRHFDQALRLLQRALPGLPARRDDILFSIGRAYFSSEQYEAAEKTYLEGAPVAKDGETRASFLYQASRCAQLLGDDKRAEAHLTRAIPAGGTTTRASAALTQRIRIRVRQGRFAEAAADLKTVRARFSKTHAVVEATLAYAIGLVGAGRGPAAAQALDALKPKLLEKRDVPEVQYWKARGLEARQPRAALALYLKVLRADTPTHFAYFARHRLTLPHLAKAVRADEKRRSAEAAKSLAKRDLDGARQLQTDSVLLSPQPAEEGELEELADIYRRLPAYQGVLELPPPSYPRFPIFGDDPSAPPGRFELLLAAGLFDDAVDLILARYPLHPLPSGVARSEALRRGEASRASIYAAEVTAKEDIPGDYVPQLLPRLVRELLYPRYFHRYIVEQSRKYDADPKLVLSIMREESRFNPRAKSAAAARGLLQFIITTARQVGEAVGLVNVSAEDLYEPPVIIQLGSKYIADLLREFGGDPYKAAAAYNAGPNQARLWSRMAPGEGDDLFLSAINFDETKDYVRKVLNSYERYGEIYENEPPAGGVRAEP